MSEPASFLSPAQGEQQELLPACAASFFTELESRGEFTGERLYQQRPDTYKAIVVLLAQKVGVRRIGQYLSVSPNTVMAVRDREGATIDTVKDHIARTANDGATIVGETILERVNQIATDPMQIKCLAPKDLKDLAVIFGILVQNGQLLAGQPTARVEVTEVKPEHDSFNAYIASLGSANPLSREKIADKGAVLDLEAAPADLDAAGAGSAHLGHGGADLAGAPADSVSEVSPPKPL